jgi:hypothetical protein
MGLLVIPLLIQSLILLCTGWELADRFESRVLPGHIVRSISTSHAIVVLLGLLLCMMILMLTTHITYSLLGQGFLVHNIFLLPSTGWFLVQWNSGASIFREI